MDSQIITNLELLREPSEQLKIIQYSENDKEISEKEIELSKQIMKKLDDVFNSDSSILAVAAPQIGINKRLFGIKINDEINYFINPIITKKTGLAMSAETFLNCKNKEYLIGRPTEITTIFYDKHLKYVDMKLTGFAARIFDQMSQLLDGVLPSDLGLESDIEIDGKLSDLSEEDLQEISEIWKQFVNTKLKALEKDINSNSELKNIYRQLKFTEDVINGRTLVIKDNNTSLNRQKRRELRKKIKKHSK